MPMIFRFLAACVLAGLFAPPVAARQAPAPTPQAHVHAHAHEVMPFEMAKVEHVFRMTETGGVMRVVVRDSANATDLQGVRRHLREQATRFAGGDFGAPMHLHGASMPGLAELGRGAAGLKVSYAELPNGAEIRLESGDIALVTAVHRWFGAQLSEHGADARAE
jgi:hypothetical protein